MSTHSSGELLHDGEPRVRSMECPRCGEHYEMSTGFVTRDGLAHAIYYAACHHHEGEHEAWMDVTLGSWALNDDEPEPGDHSTFSCRVGPGPRSADPYATLVQPTVAAEGGNPRLFGELLSREEAQLHPRLSDFWRVVDFVLLHDSLVRQHVYRTPHAD